MPNIRHKHKNKKWWISENESRLAYSFAMMYNEWKATYDALDGWRTAPTNDTTRPTNAVSSPTEQDAIKREELFRKMEIVDQTLIEADPYICQWLKISVTNPGVTYNALRQRGMACCPDMYYDRRRKFYFLLSKKI
jgi:hypothetical protein